MPDTEPQPTLNIPETARDLNVSEQTVKRLIASGELPAFKIRAATRIRREDVEALKQSRPVVPAAEARLDAYINRVVDSASELTAAQRDRLAALLAGAR